MICTLKPILIANTVVTYSQSTIPYVFTVLIHLIQIITLSGRCSYSHFINEETKIKIKQLAQDY